MLFKAVCTVLVGVFLALDYSLCDPKSATVIVGIVVAMIAGASIYKNYTDKLEG